MSNEYEYIFHQLVNPLRLSNFHEYHEIEDDKPISFVTRKFNCKSTVHTQKISGKIIEYSLQLRDFSTDEKILLINYQHKAEPFIPETVRYYEPTWQDFTDQQLAKAIKYLSPLLNMKMNTDRKHYTMLVHKDKFHLNIRTSRAHDDYEHSLTITAYNYSLD